MFGKKKQITVAENVEAYSRANSGTKYMKARHGRSRRKVVVSVVIGLLVVLLGGIGAAWAYMNNRLTSGVTAEARAALTDVADGEPFYMLLLGIDKNEERASGTRYGAADSAYRSDSMIVARIDPGNRKVTLLSLHRDTKIENLMGQGTQKLNACFTFGGVAGAISTVNDFVGVEISHFAEIDMDGLAAVVDAVGGIDVDLPIDVIDRTYTHLELQAGEQHIDGETAVLLCRARHAYDSYGDGDLYRAANQRMVIMAVIEKVLKSDPVTMASTLTAMAEMVTTDYDVASIISLASQMRGIDVSKDIMTGMEPTDGSYENETWYEIPIEPNWTNMKQRFRDGLALYDGSTYDETAGVAAEMSNGRDSGELPTTTVEDATSGGDDDDYDDDGYYDEDEDY